MIKNGEIIMCQDDVAQLCSQAKVAKQLAGQSLSLLQEASRAHSPYSTDTQVCPSTLWPGLLGTMEIDLRDCKVLR
jgi:hypothetical protein